MERILIAISEVFLIAILEVFKKPIAEQLIKIVRFAAKFQEKTKKPE